jgi:hypothetical protein
MSIVFHDISTINRFENIFDISLSRFSLLFMSADCKTKEFSCLFLLRNC